MNAINQNISKMKDENLESTGTGSTENISLFTDIDLTEISLLTDLKVKKEITEVIEQMEKQENDEKEKFESEKMDIENKTEITEIEEKSLSNTSLTKSTIILKTEEETLSFVTYLFVELTVP